MTKDLRFDDLRSKKNNYTDFSPLIKFFKKKINELQTNNNSKEFIKIYEKFGFKNELRAMKSEQKHKFYDCKVHPISTQAKRLIFSFNVGRPNKNINEKNLNSHIWATVKKLEK